MSFLSDFGQGMLANAQQQSPLLNSAVSTYQRRRMNGPGMSGPQMADALHSYNNDGPPSEFQPPAPPQPELEMPKIGQGYQAETPSTGAMDARAGQWNPNQPDPQSGGGGLATLAAGAMGLPVFDQGVIVTQPTRAKLAADGRPEAVIPLTPRSGQKMSPDLLEGHITAPKVSGVRYSRYKTFNRFGRGGGA